MYGCRGTISCTYPVSMRLSYVMNANLSINTLDESKSMRYSHIGYCHKYHIMMLEHLMVFISQDPFGRSIF